MTIYIQIAIRIAFRMLKRKKVLEDLKMIIPWYLPMVIRLWDIINTIPQPIKVQYLQVVKLIAVEINMYKILSLIKALSRII